jgi:hypothetical protein
MKLIRDTDLGYDLHEYFAYLRENEKRFPPRAYEFASAPWHYDIRDHKCPHDSWLETLTISEPAQGEHKEIRDIDIVAKLLGAYHDGIIELTYKHVRRYSLGMDRTSLGAPLALYSKTRGHGDWIVDEVLVKDDGSISHEVEFHVAGHWIIECADLIYRWHPNAASGG